MELEPQVYLTEFNTQLGSSYELCVMQGTPVHLMFSIVKHALDTLVIHTFQIGAIKEQDD